jgi:hypothetical protein
MSSAAGEPWPWRRALAWLLFLGPFFFASYGFATWTAARRALVPSVVFDWERALPFWAWTIVPYWSIDLLYGISLFACTSRRELDTHAKRLLTAQLVAIAFFIACPLRFSFARPAADGVFGAMFDALAQFDQPFNQLPSLHLALALILWALYARRLRGWARHAMTAWFVLIGASVLTTYQHHFIDVPTGLALGLVCLWLWPFADEGDGRSPVTQWQRTADPARRRLALWYGIGAIASATVAVAIGGVALWLLWASASLALVSLAYAAFGPGAFQKRGDGKVSLASRWLFAPTRAGAWLNSRLWTLKDPGPVPVADGVWLGRVPTARELARLPVASVVDLTAEFVVAVAPGTCDAIPALDLVPPDAGQLAHAIAAIERRRTHGPVLVCCALGASRSACAVAAWLLATGRAADVAAAVATIRRARSRIVLGSGHVAALDGVTLRTGPA